VEPAERHDLDVARGGRAGHGVPREAVAEPADRVQAGLDRRQLEPTGELALRALHQHRQALGVELPHAPQVAAEVALGDEVAHHGLLEQRRVAADQR